MLYIIHVEIGITLEEAVQIHQTVKEETNKCHLNKNQTAFDLLQKHNDGTPQHIVSFCEKLDTMLGGGMPIGHVTECSGVPGSGKTQLWLVFDLLDGVECSCYFYFVYSHQ